MDMGNPVLPVCSFIICNGCSVVRGCGLTNPVAVCFSRSLHPGKLLSQTRKQTHTERQKKSMHVFLVLSTADTMRLMT